MPRVVVCVLATLTNLIPVMLSAQQEHPLSEECNEILHSAEKESDNTDPTARERCLKEYRSRTATYELVVTANRIREEIANVPASMSVVPALEIERSIADSVADALRDVPGVEVSDAGEPGLKRIRIRGEESQRITILIDGQEFFDPRDVGTPILIAPEMIERIEVLRGPASVIYGSRAFGGVVNIITKKGGYHPVQGSASVAFDSSTRGFQEFGSLFGEIEQFEYRLAIAGADAGNRHSAEGEIDPSEYRNKSTLTYLGRQIGDHHVSFNYQMFDGNSDVYVEPEVRTAPPFVDFQIDAPQRDREKYAVFYDYESEETLIQSAHVDLFRQLSVRQLNTDSTTVLDPISQLQADTSILSFASVHGVGGNAYIDIVPNENVSLIVGAQGSFDDLHQTRDRTVRVLEASRPTEMVVDEARLDSMAGYSRVEWQVVPDWELSLGGRLNWTESELKSTNRAGLEPQTADDTAFIGSASFLYSGVQDATLWVRAGQGYQYPSLNQSATGAFAGPSFVNPNFTLDPETSWEYEIGGRYETQNVSAELSLFYTDADDYIDHVLCSSTSAFCIVPTGMRDRVYVNIDSANTWGAEGEFRYSWNEWAPYVRGAWIRRRFDREDYTTFDTGIAPVSGRIGLQYERELSAWYGLWGDAYVRSESRSEEYDGSETIVNPGWATMNIALGIECGTKRHLRFGIEFLNIFDKYYREATENIPARGSAVLARVSAQF